MTTKKPRKEITATIAEVCQWIQDGVFRCEDGRVFKGEKELAQRINKRRQSERGDPRVDLFHEGKRRSCNVSQLAWMQETKQPIPSGFEIHHFDQNPLNNDPDNLFCCHPFDHMKVHANQTADEDAIPF